MIEIPFTDCRPVGVVIVPGQWTYTTITHDLWGRAIAVLPVPRWSSRYDTNQLVLFDAHGRDILRFLFEARFFKAGQTLEMTYQLFPKPKALRLFVITHEGCLISMKEITISTG